jgi:hypothetical protein
MTITADNSNCQGSPTVAWVGLYTSPLTASPFEASEPFSVTLTFQKKKEVAQNYIWPDGRICNSINVMFSHKFMYKQYKLICALSWWRKQFPESHSPGLFAIHLPADTLMLKCSNAVSHQSLWHKLTMHNSFYIERAFSLHFSKPISLFLAMLMMDGLLHCL